ncbi:hypothetical protein [Georgenia yuyongxinii]|uniref:Uncharacterized protein n=1 Tax=Georgenia yuyongxinii TaxID=2589797 RepID=A0A552WX48_9MICO|nr:hypothetical protein [Georgenia yuyongxinii]TRW46883.1 hypothetical protein FJ693_04020 [Georgenia yuyongxinii]
MTDETADGMSGAPRRALGALIVTALTVTACSDRGDLTISNDGPRDVTVVTGDQEITVDAYGGAALLGYGCSPGDVIVAFTTGLEIVLAGPVCPDQRIVVGDGTATLQPLPADAA